MPLLGITWLAQLQQDLQVAQCLGAIDPGRQGGSVVTQRFCGHCKGLAPGLRANPDTGSMISASCRQGRGKCNRGDLGTAPHGHLKRRSPIVGHWDDPSGKRLGRTNSVLNRVQVPAVQVFSRAAQEKRLNPSRVSRQQGNKATK
jgi:hypothetical protein